MTRINKIVMINIARPNAVEFHYRIGKTYQRLVIDKVGEITYPMSVDSQAIAVKAVDSLYQEVFENDQISEKSST